MRLLSILLFFLQTISCSFGCGSSSNEIYHASIRDQEVIQLMDDLDDSNETILNFYSTQYFSNLKKISL